MAWRLPEEGRGVRPTSGIFRSCLRGMSSPPFMSPPIQSRPGARPGAVVLCHLLPEWKA